MPGIPNPENTTEQRLVFCTKCHHIFHSRSLRPLCGSCRSAKVVNYTSVPHDPVLQEKVEILSLTVSNQEETIRILHETLSEMKESLSKTRKKISFLNNKLEKVIASSPQPAVSTNSSSLQPAVSTNSSARSEKTRGFPSSPGKIIFP